jgi:hypothetical protein
MAGKITVPLTKCIISPPPHTAATAAPTNARMEGVTHAPQPSIIRPAPRMPPTAALRSGRSEVSRLATDARGEALAQDAGYVERGVERQTLEEAMEWVWKRQ